MRRSNLPIAYRRALKTLKHLDTAHPFEAQSCDPADGLFDELFVEVELRAAPMERARLDMDARIQLLGVSVVPYVFDAVVLARCGVRPASINDPASDHGGRQ